VTFDTADARSQLDGERVVFAHSPTTRNVPNLLRNMLVARRVLAAEQPDMVVSTGAGVAIPFFLLARLRGRSTIYLEVFDRIDSRTVTGRVCKPLSTEFLVQWEAQRVLYDGGRVIGPLL
jgi:UDP-N-acetylglucosamine:LPS N-acetylglucosamine transferase